MRGKFEGLQVLKTVKLRGLDQVLCKVLQTRVPVISKLKALIKHSAGES